MNLNLRPLLTALLTTAAGYAADATKDHVETGTDPTKVIQSFKAAYEFISLNNGVDSGTLRLDYVQPLGEKKDYSLMYRVPLATLEAGGRHYRGLGDASLKVGHVFGLSREGGYVAQGEMAFNTASKVQLGTGQNVFKGTFIAAYFLKGGAIFAPAFVQSQSLWGDRGRSRVTLTTMDFYYVPKMPDPRDLLTFDPSINVDWKTKKEYLNLAITYGRVIGKAFGGNAILMIKPSVFFGGERPGSWGIEAGYKVLGF